MDALEVAGRAIDEANTADPNRFRGQPLARFQGIRAVEWVARLAPDAWAAVLLAARGHHLRRWTVPRSSYPEGRAGYLRWRRDQKQRHADELTALLLSAGYDDVFAARVSELVRRIGLGTDPEAQLVEDAACLVFLETQYDGIVARLDQDTLEGVVAKTLAKMSTAAIELARGEGLLA